MPKRYQPPECDVVVLAGDIGTGRMGMAWAMEAFPKELPVVYIAGNHEFYGRSLALIEELRAKAAATPNIKFLENDSFELNGTTIIGGTLWTDFRLHDDPVKSAIDARFGMNDFVQISGFDVQTWLDRNTFARGFITGRIEKAGGGQNCVVVTHHAPHSGSIPDRFAGQPLNPAFASKFLQELPEHLRPRAWLHGHTHDSFDYLANISTRVICNPRGYVGHELNEQFDIGLVVDV